MYKKIFYFIIVSFFCFSGCDFNQYNDLNVVADEDFKINLIDDGDDYSQNDLGNEGDVDIEDVDTDLEIDVDTDVDDMDSSQIVGLLNENTDVAFYKAPVASVFFDGGIANYEMELDENGIPLKYGKYHPSRIAQYTIDLYAEHLKDPDNEVLVEKLIKSASWLYDNLEEKEGRSVWVFYDIYGYMMETPWSSALTNSWGAIALVYAAYLYPEKRDEYLASAIKAFNYLFIPMSENGGLGFWDNGSIWFEEYPNIEKPNHVLNGFLFSLDTLIILNDLIEDEILANNLMLAFESLEKNVLEFDAWYGSYYDYYGKRNKIGEGYHDLHWQQIAWANYKTNKDIFYNISQRWFEAQNQTVGNVEVSSTIDSTQHGSEVLNDKIYWYGYWSSKVPVDIKLSFDSEQKIYGFNLFYYEGCEHDLLEIYYKDSSGNLKQVEQDDLIYMTYGSNSTNGHDTVVIPIKFKEVLKTKEILLKVKSLKNSDIVALREIGIMRDLSIEFEKKYYELILEHKWYLTKKYLY